MELTMNKGGNNRSSSPTEDMSVEKKLKTSSTAHDDLSVVERPVIGITSSNGKKNEAARSEHVVPSMLRIASTIVNKIAQRKCFIMPLMSKSVPGRSLGAKFGSPLEILAIMKSGKVDSAAKMAPRPTPFTVETDLPARKEDIACMGSCENSTKPVSGEAAEICVLLKLDMLEVMDACAKFVDSSRKVVCPSSFAKHTTQYRMTALLAMMPI
ncbi:hypothetical protein EV2_027685 [Malus domestica]